MKSNEKETYFCTKFLFSNIKYANMWFVYIQ